MVWRTNKPVEADRLKNLGGIIRDNKTAFDVAVQKCFYWSDSESSAGVVTSSATTGTARAFYAASSALSTDNISVNTSGRLFLDSTNKRLYVLGESTATTLVGSIKGIVCNYDVGKGAAALASNKRILVQAGNSGEVGLGATAVSYATTYSATPSLMVMVSHATGGTAPVGDGSKGMYSHYITNQATTGFTCTLTWESAEAEGAVPGGFYWRAEGEISV